jgi:hypothetical protein
MAVGLHTVNLANKWLDMLRGVAFTAPTNIYVKLHTADPQGAATNAPSANTTRVIMTLAAASGGIVALTGTQPSWASWASGAETESHISVWDNLTVGLFLLSAALTTPKAVANGDTLTLTSFQVSLAPLAA